MLTDPSKFHVVAYWFSKLVLTLDFMMKPGKYVVLIV